jgi:hypothetical protein
MPINIPDPAVHKLCRRCRKWFDPADGELTFPEATGPASRLRIAAVRLAGDESALSFICHRCLRTRRITKVVLWVGLGLAAAIAMLVAWIQGR